MYKATPITKRAGSPLYLNETLVEGSKQTNKKFSSGDPFRTTIKEEGTEGTPDTTKTVTKEKPQVGGYRRACGSKNDGSTGIDPETGDSYNCKQAEKGKEPKETEEIVETVKGEKGTPDTYDSVQTKRQDFGTNVGDWENREMNRVTKKAGKDVRRGEAKKARIENKKAKFEDKLKRDEEGNIIAPKAGEKGYRKYKKLEAKETETTRELTDFENRQKNAAKGQASGKGLDQSYRRADVDESQADFSRPEQVQMIKASNEAKRSAETDVQRYAEKAKNIGMDGFKLQEVDFSKSNAFVNKYGGSALTMKRSPMKKNYFKK